MKFNLHVTAQLTAVTATIQKGNAVPYIWSQHQSSIHLIQMVFN